MLWIVDVNRQSLDGVVPAIAAARLAGMFEAAGWHVITVKYGRRLTGLDDMGGLACRIDAMTNEEYQRMVRSSIDEVRARVLEGEDRGGLKRAIAESTTSCWWRSCVISAATTSDCCSTLSRRPDAVKDRPTVIFAFTIKA